MNSAPSHHPLPSAGTSRWAIAGVAVLVALGTVVRAWAARDEFWLDEIWSLMAFTRMPHAWRNVFTFHHDNNHYPITLWMDLVGPDRRDWMIYRLPSLLASVGTVILAARVTALGPRRHGHRGDFHGKLLRACLVWLRGARLRPLRFLQSLGLSKRWIGT